LVVLLFIGGIILDFNVLNIIPIKLDTAQKIIDQRASNIATIMSITLVVVGFLMNNIAVKESFSYQMLFKRSYFYPIIYLVLSVIAYFFVVSILRDCISSVQFIRLVLIGTYMALFILFVIGYLFKRIIQFTNSEKIVSLLHDEVIKEARNNLRQSLFREYSKDLYRDFMQQAGCDEYNFMDAWDISKFTGSFTVSDTALSGIDEEASDEKRILYDINLGIALKFVNRKMSDGRLVFKGLTLDIPLARLKDDYVWIKGTINSDKEKKYMRKMLVMKNPPPLRIKEVSTPREYLDQKLEEWSSDGKSTKKLEQLLGTYRELYKMKVQNTKSSNDV